MTVLRTQVSIQIPHETHPATSPSLYRISLQPRLGRTAVETRWVLLRMRWPSHQRTDTRCPSSRSTASPSPSSMIERARFYCASLSLETARCGTSIRLFRRTRKIVANPQLSKSTDHRFPRTQPSAAVRPRATVQEPLRGLQPAASVSSRTKPQGLAGQAISRHSEAWRWSRTDPVRGLSWRNGRPVLDRLRIQDSQLAIDCRAALARTHALPDLRRIRCLGALQGNVYIANGHGAPPMNGCNVSLRVHVTVTVDRPHDRGANVARKARPLQWVA